ncbi:DUF6894 family protein [Microvirga massiliensis]|uniref:DUF6894 family protein n=1 Tax=Microvirga massiliensis TaxID=1033741 RepID=UPI00062B37F6|nr:hypothetical protein [Microvirga massiliensis]
MSRYYLHLANQHEIILDKDGVEATDPDEVYTETVRALEELRRKSPAEAPRWEGWRLDVTEASGVVIFSISLAEPLH